MDRLQSLAATKGSVTLGSFQSAISHSVLSDQINLFLGKKSDLFPHPVPAKQFHQLAWPPPRQLTAGNSHGSTVFPLALVSPSSFQSGHTSPEQLRWAGNFIRVSFLTVSELSRFKRLIFHFGSLTAPSALRAVVRPCLFKHHHPAASLALSYFCKRLHYFPAKASVVVLLSHSLHLVCSGLTAWNVLNNLTDDLQGWRVTQFLLLAV